MTEQEYNQALIDRRYHIDGMNKAHRIILKYERLQRRNQDLLNSQPAIEKAKELIQEHGLKVNTKHRELANKRHTLMYWLCIYTPLTHSQVAELFDMKKPSVSYAMKLANERELEKNEDIWQIMNQYKCSQSSK